MYVARHSWATIARGMHIPVSVISDSLGHDSEKTTQIYLKSIDEDIIDRTNDMLMAAIEKGGNSNSNLRAGDNAKFCAGDCNLRAGYIKCLV